MILDIDACATCLGDGGVGYWCLSGSGGGWGGVWGGEGGGGVYHSIFFFSRDCCVEHCVGASGVFMWVWEGIDTDMGMSRLFIFALSKLLSRSTC